MAKYKGINKKLMLFLNNGRFYKRFFVFC